jgi:hypothetical protein
MTLVYYIAVSLLVALSFGAQEFVPALEFAQQARVLLPPVFFFSAALSISFPMMLVLALFSGLVWDARHLPYRTARDRSANVAELAQGLAGSESRAVMGQSLPFGYTAAIFGALGAMMQGVRPLFKRGRWELPVLFVGAAVFVWLLTEYFLLSFLRGSFYFPPRLWTKVTTSSLLAMLAAPVVLYTLHTIARALRFESRTEGFTFRFHGG